MRMFDRKFGERLIEELPGTPAVYLFKDGRGAVIYVGKAGNIRRRLQQYRNATRRKVHRKMRTLVREATELEVIHRDSEREALLLENELIRKLRPSYNEDGTYDFLYPAIGIGGNEKQVLLCFTTHVDAWKDLDLRWYGVFKSRRRALAAFDALVYLLGLVGHIERTAHLPPYERIRGSRLTGFRRLTPEIVASLDAFLSGAGHDTLVPLTRQLLEKPLARRDASEVQRNIRMLKYFHDRDLAPLRAAMRSSGKTGTYVPQDERDALFLSTDERYDESGAHDEESKEN
ncbi:MAG: nucleotide excision repair endonuclease [Gemmatimonadetes bacterium]|nr:nucleotide excision repair endonuclease [Gemmatimonadota bacterium]